VGHSGRPEPLEESVAAILVLTAAVIPAIASPAEPGGAVVATGEAALARHLRGRPGPDDTVRALSSKFGLSRVYVRSEMRWAGWPLRESARDPFRIPRRPPVITLQWVVLGVAEVIGQVYSSTPPPPDTAPT
jgi:hypothetical protein